MRADAGGCVITMASDAGLLGFRGGWAAYCAAMGGVVNLTRQLAIALAPGIRVIALAPGPVGTEHLYQDLTSASYGGFEGAGDVITAVAESLPMGRIIEPDEIARAVLFVAAMASMTGSVLSIDRRHHDRAALTTHHCHLLRPGSSRPGQPRRPLARPRGHGPM
jgi:3-hydroxybutyrate dehydrogenase